MDVVTSQRWVGVGNSQALESHRAGREATVAALAGRDDARLLVVFCSERHDLHELLGAINLESGRVPLIGCSTAGEIATGGPDDEGVVIFALGGPGFSITTAVAEHASHDLRAAGATGASAALGVDVTKHSVLLMLTDALAGDQQEILRGAYGVVGASIQLVGGCAGDDLKMERTFQLHGDSVLSDAIVTAAITSDAPIGIGVRHGWTTIGQPMLVTRSSGKTVHELDGRPALDVYLELLEAPTTSLHDTASFTRFAMLHPLGLARRSAEPHVRFVAGADFATRALECFASVPEGAAIWLMQGDAESVLTATDAACHDALDAISPHRPAGLLAFDCIARRGVLTDDGIHREIARIAHLSGGAPVAGFYTYGEIARTRGVSGFHNDTLVVLAVA